MTQQDPTASRVAAQATGAAVGTPSRRTRTGRRVRLAVAATSALAATVLLAGCGDHDAGASVPQKVKGSAAPVAGDAARGGKSKGPGDKGSGGDASKGPSDSSRGGAGGAGDTGQGGTGGSGDAGGSGPEPTASNGGAAPGDPDGGACRTAGLSASVGPGSSGAGQRNHPLILTNDSSRTCTVSGYPGMAFVDDASNQVSVDPQRAPGVSEEIQLSPGESAWAPLSFPNPGMTDAPEVTPASVTVTPPGETASLSAGWPGGPVAEAGTASAPKVGPFRPGTGG